MIIDKNSPIPQYFQLQTWLIEQIEQGIFKPDDKIPTEEELLKTIKELPDNQIDIGLVSLVIAKDIYPDIDISIYIKELDAMAKELSGKIGAEKNPEKLLAIFNNYINQGEEKYIIMMRMH